MNKVVKIGLLTGAVVAVAAVAAFYFFSELRVSDWRRSMEAGRKAFAAEDLSVASKEFASAAVIAKSKFGEKDPKYLESLQKLAWVHAACKDYTGARRLYAQLQPIDPARAEIAQMIFFYDPEGLLDTKSDRGVRGINLYVSELSRMFGKNDPELVRLLIPISHFYERSEDFPAAEAELRKVVDIQENTEGPHSIGRAQAHAAFGELYDHWAFFRKEGISDEEFQKLHDTMLEKSRAEFNNAVAMITEVKGDSAPELRPVQTQLKQVGTDSRLKFQEVKAPSKMPEL